MDKKENSNFVIALLILLITVVMVFFIVDYKERRKKRKQKLDAELDLLLNHGFEVDAQNFAQDKANIMQDISNAFNKTIKENGIEANTR